MYQGKIYTGFIGCPNPTSHFGNAAIGIQDAANCQCFAVQSDCGPLPVCNEWSFVRIQWLSYPDYKIITVVSPALQLLETVALNQAGIITLGQLLPGIGQSSERAIRFGSKALEWLLRAWIEHDPVSKFTFLFIALEVVLGKVTKDNEPLDESVSRIKSLSIRTRRNKGSGLRYFERRFGP